MHMLPPVRLHPSRALVRFTVWLLAALLPLQAVAATVLAARGPSHVHVPAKAETADILRAFGHFHRAGAAERHHHAAGDTSVVHSGDGAAIEQDSKAAGTTLAAFVALLSAPLGCTLPPATTVHAEHRPWAWLTHLPERLERPPRSAAA